MTFPKLSRRHLLQGSAATALAATMPGRAAFAADTVVGFIYVGPRDDYGYNQAHAVAAAALKKMPGVKVVEEENVPETDAVEKTMESMINLDGAKLIFPTSFGYFDPHVAQAGRRSIRRSASPTAAACGPRQAPEERRQLLRLHRRGAVRRRRRRRPLSKTTSSASSPPSRSAGAAQHQRLHCSARRLANPNATMQVIFTGDWSMPVKEAEATNSLVDAGVDVITCHVDGPKVVIETAERRGVHGRRATTPARRRSRRRAISPAPSGTGRRSTRASSQMQTKGETIPNFFRGGLKEGFVKIAPYGAEGLGSGAQAGRRRSRPS